MSEKRVQILKAAEKLFASGRYHKVTLDEVCKKAGVGKGTVYRYFEGKEDLYYQVILTGLDQMVESVARVAAQEEDPRRGLRKLVGCVAEFFARRRALFSLMYSEQLRASHRKKKIWKQRRARVNKVRDVAAGFIRKGIEQGCYVSSLPPQVAARFLIGMIRVAMRNRDEMPEDEGWQETIVDFFEKGLLVRDGSD